MGGWQEDPTPPPRQNSPLQFYDPPLLQVHCPWNRPGNHRQGCLHWPLTPRQLSQHSLRSGLSLAGTQILPFIIHHYQLVESMSTVNWTGLEQEIEKSQNPVKGQSLQNLPPCSEHSRPF